MTEAAAPTFTTSETDPFSSYGLIQVGRYTSQMADFFIPQKLKGYSYKNSIIGCRYYFSRGTQNSTQEFSDISDSAFTEVSNLRADISGNTSGR